MSKLKTLKTLKDIDALVHLGSVDVEPHYRKDDLRDTAREWIKHYRKEIIILERQDKEYEAEDIIAGRPSQGRPDITREVMSMRGAIAVLKHFFNLDD